VHRIFPFLVLFAAAFFAATMFVGFAVDLGGQFDMAARRMMDLHFLSALATSLVVLLVNGIVVTYFIGTSRWCREVVDTYSLPAELAQDAQRLKRRTFPFSAGNMLLVVGLMSLGAAAHTRVPPLPGMTWSEIHLLGVFLFLAFMAWASYVQWTNIRANQDVIARILNEVRAIRAAKGLQ
jgi:hypothetical protein